MLGNDRLIGIYKYLFSLAIITSLSAGPAAAQMGKKSNICGSWNNYCRGAPSGGGGGSYGYGGSTQMWMGVTQSLMGSFMQGFQRGMEQNRRRHNQATAFNINRQGVRDYKNGNYHSALQKFRNAARYAPHDSTIQHNIRNALEQIERQRRAADRRRKAQLAAAKKRINRLIGNLESDLNRNSKSSTLDSAGVDFTKPGGTSFFGTGGGPGTPLSGANQQPHNQTAHSGGLDFAQSSEQLFSKGTKYSAPVNLQPGATNQLAIASPIGADINTKGQPVDPSNRIEFIAPGQKIARVSKPPANIKPGYNNGTFARIERNRWPKFEKPLLDFNDNLMSKGVKAVGQGYWSRLKETAKRETADLLKHMLPKSTHGLIGGAVKFRMPAGIKAIQNTLKGANAMRKDLAKPYKNLLNSAMKGADEGSKMFAEVKYDQQVIDEYEDRWIRGTEGVKKSAKGIIAKKAERKILGQLKKAGRTWDDHAKAGDLKSDVRTIRWLKPVDYDRVHGKTEALKNFQDLDRRKDSTTNKTGMENY